MSIKMKSLKRNFISAEIVTQNKILPTFQITLIVLPLLMSLIYHSEGTCPTNNARCQSDTTYQFCITISGQDRLIGSVTSCPDGTVCSETGSVM